MHNSKKKFKLENLSKEQIQSFIKKKRECESRAQNIVTGFLEQNITKDLFLSKLPYINQSQYEDITVERALTKLCGYPLCNSKLNEKIPNQTYRISTKTNQVYDIRERKNFCTNQCYKASLHIKGQILSSPLWLREEYCFSNFELLSLNSRGIPGEIVDLSITEKVMSDTKCNTDFTSLLDFTSTSLNEMEKNSQNKNENKIDIKNIESKKECTDAEKSQNIDNTNFKLDLKNSSTNSSKKEFKNIKPKKKTKNIGLIGNVFEKNLEKQINSPLINEYQNEENMNKPVSSLNELKNNKEDNNELITQIEQALGEWFTVNTMFYLFGDKKVEEIIKDKGKEIKEHLNNTSFKTYGFEKYDQYQKLCRKLNFLELEEQKYDEEINLKPLSDYTILQKEAELMNFKVETFFKGDIILKNQPIKEIKENQFNEDPSPTNLPLVDKHSQYAFRCKILLNKLDRVLPDLLRALNLTARDISGDVRQLIETFDLKAHNITFKSIQWELISIIIIKLLSLRGPKLKDRLDMPKAYKHLELLLLSYKLDHGYLNRLICWLTDIDRIIKVEIK